jgi:predicted transcriptional regulator
MKMVGERGLNLRPPGPEPVLVVYLVASLSTVLRLVVRHSGTIWTQVSAPSWLDPRRFEPAGRRRLTSREPFLMPKRLCSCAATFLPWDWSHGYTIGMKTAISIPDDLFDGAERLARRTRRSRSRLFTDAVREYLARHAPDKVTESMDQAIMEIGQGNDEFVYSVARRTLEQTEW